MFQEGKRMSETMHPGDYIRSYAASERLTGPGMRRSVQMFVGVVVMSCI